MYKRQAFFAVPGSEINDDNEVQQIIAEKTGVKVKETWLTGQTAEEAIGTLAAGDEYPDFICGGNGIDWYKRQEMSRRWQQHGWRRKEN